MTTYALNEFAILVDYFQVKIWLEYNQEDSGRTGGGEDISTDLSDPQWRGEIMLDQRMTHADAAAADALIEGLNGVIGRFYMYDPRLPYPIRDPDGSLLGSATVRILDISANRKQVKLKNLPNNYWISRGDRFHVEFGTDPVHRGYYRMRTTLQADGSSNTDWIDIAPHLSDGISINDIVELKRPSPLWRLEAKSVQSGAGQGQLTPGATFRMVQVP